MRPRSLSTACSVAILLPTRVFSEISSCSRPARPSRNRGDSSFSSSMVTATVAVANLGLVPPSRAEIFNLTSASFSLSICILVVISPEL